jgi:hypothetical protein
LGFGSGFVFDVFAVLPVFPVLPVFAVFPVLPVFAVLVVGGSEVGTEDGVDVGTPEVSREGVVGIRVGYGVGTSKEGVVGTGVGV